MRLRGCSTDAARGQGQASRRLGPRSTGLVAPVLKLIREACVLCIRPSAAGAPSRCRERSSGTGVGLQANRSSQRRRGRYRHTKELCCVLNTMLVYSVNQIRALGVNDMVHGHACGSGTPPRTCPPTSDTAPRRLPNPPRASWLGSPRRKEEPSGKPHTQKKLKNGRGKSNSGPKQSHHAPGWAIEGRSHLGYGEQGSVASPAPGGRGTAAHSSPWHISAAVPPGLAWAWPGAGSPRRSAAVRRRSSPG